MKEYDLIIIGGGITGLSTAIAWLKTHPKENNRVLIVEQHSIVGGCVTTFAREGYRFDTAQIIPDISELLDFFGIETVLKKFDDYYARIYIADPVKKNATIFSVPSLKARFIKYLKQLSPDDSRNIDQFFKFLEEMHHELHYLKTEPNFLNILNILIHCPKIIRLRKKTYDQFLRRFNFKNKILYEVLDLFSSFSGLSAERCSALLTASALNTTLEGSYRPVNGFIQFPQIMRKKIESMGGEIRTQAMVKKIIIENNTATAIELSDGTRYHARYIVTTADTKVSLLRLVGIENLKAADKHYAQKADRVAMSPSSFFIHLGIDEALDLKKLGFDCGYNVLTTGGDTFEKMYRAFDKDELLLSDSLFHCGVVCPSLKTGGKPVISIHVVPASVNGWIDLRERDREQYHKKKQNIADHYIRLVEQYMIPGLQQNIRFIDINTPATFARFLNSPTGSNFDMMPVPSNFGMYRLKMRTPIKNLFLPKFSNGIWPSMQAGIQVVDMITGGAIMSGNSRYSVQKKS